MITTDTHGGCGQQSHYGHAPNLVQVFEAIGRFDAELCAEDARFEAMLGRDLTPTASTQLVLSEADSLDARIYLSTLWLFGAYEAVRTLSGAVDKRRTKFGARLVTRTKVLKRLLNRPRVILAKHEPAFSHKADTVPAMPWLPKGSIAPSRTRRSDA